MVQLEAMACGKPVISSSTIPENDRININGVTGLTVDPHSSYSIAGALKRILQSEDVSFEFGRNALAHVRENYNIDKAGETVFSLFQQLMSEFIPRDFFGDQGSSADNSTGGIKDDEKDNSTV
jgi:rhamnosyl/mannosyltransferase